MDINTNKFVKNINAKYIFGIIIHLLLTLQFNSYNLQVAIFQVTI